MKPAVENALIYALAHDGFDYEHISSMHPLMVGD